MMWNAVKCNRSQLVDVLLCIVAQQLKSATQQNSIVAHSLAPKK